MGEIMGKITVEIPNNVSGKEILKEIETLVKLKKYDTNIGFDFLNDYDKKRALKIAEFVENYLKKNYPKVKFNLSLEYDDSDDEIVIGINYSSKLSTDERLKIVDEIRDAVRNSITRKERHKIYIVCY